MRLLAFALGFQWALVAYASAGAPSLALGPELPFTEAELRSALELRLPDARALEGRVVSIRSAGAEVVVELGSRRAALAVGGARGPDAARLVALALLDLLSDEPPPPSAPQQSDGPPEPPPAPLPEAVRPAVTRAAAEPPPGSRRPVDRGAFERSSFMRLVVAPSLGVPIDALEPWTAALSIGLGHVMEPALLEVDVEGWFAPAAPSGSFHSGWFALRARVQAGLRFAPIELLLGPAIVPVWVLGGDGYHDVLFAIGGCARASLRFTPSLVGFVSIGADVFPHRIELQADGESVIATPRIAPFVGVGFAWRVS